MKIIRKILTSSSSARNNPKAEVNTATIGIRIQTQSCAQSPMSF